MGRKDYQRRSKQQKQQQRFLVISEGEVTERDYLSAVKGSRLLKSAEFIFVPPGPTSPMEIVQKARQLRERARREDPFDGVWCVFDVEAKVSQRARPKLVEAINLAGEDGISVALSNPCFELWILLHDEDCQAWIDSETVQHKCKGVVDKKHIPNADALLTKYTIARTRAKKLEGMHNRNGTTDPADRNPSSSVYELVDAIYEAFPRRSNAGMRRR